MSSRTNVPAERFPQQSGHSCSGNSISGTRGAGETIGWIRTYGRTSKRSRQEVADRMALITETATVVEVEPGTYGVWRVDFVVTHRIVPID